MRLAKTEPGKIGNTRKWNQGATYGLLSNDALGGGSLGAGGLLVLDRSGGCVPGSAVGGLLLGGGEPVENVAEHCEGMWS